jgi:hypothetical protein
MKLKFLVLKKSQTIVINEVLPDGQLRELNRIAACNQVHFNFLCLCVWKYVKEGQLQALYMIKPAASVAKNSVSAS